MRRSECRLTAAAAAGEPVRTGRQVNTSMERTEESRGGLSRRLGDPVREPAPGTVATGSLGGRDSETGKRGESGKRSIPANVQPDGGRHGGWAEPVGAAYRDGNGWRGRRGDEPGLGTAGEPPGRGRGGGALLWPGQRAPPPPRRAALETGLRRPSGDRSGRYKGAKKLGSKTRRRAGTEGKTLHTGAREPVLGRQTGGTGVQRYIVTCGSTYIIIGFGAGNRQVGRRAPGLLVVSRAGREHIPTVRK